MTDSPKPPAAGQGSKRRKDRDTIRKGQTPLVVPRSTYERDHLRRLVGTGSEAAFARESMGLRNAPGPVVVEGWTCAVVAGPEPGGVAQWTGELHGYSCEVTWCRHPYTEQPQWWAVVQGPGTAEVADGFRALSPHEVPREAIAWCRGAVSVWVLVRVESPVGYTPADTGDRHG